MASRLGDVMFPNGKYMKDGQEKTSWLKCGTLLQTEKGMRLKLDALPVNMDEGWFVIFEPREDNRQAQSGSQQPKQEGFRGTADNAVDPDSDLPF
jgi:hypothetical protein